MGNTRRRRMGWLCVLAWSWAAPAAAQPEMLCGQSADGRSYCVMQSQLREGTDGIRWAPLFMGLRVVYQQAAHARIDCRTQVVEFVDNRRIAYWSAFFDESPIAWGLGGRVCEARVPQ
jgi:hypothetical protein